MTPHNDAALPGYHSLLDLARILIAQGGKCAYCQAEKRLQTDHKTPRTAAGSTNDPGNIQLVCKAHNEQKKDRTDCEFRAMLGLQPGERLSHVGKRPVANWQANSSRPGRKRDEARAAAIAQGATTYHGPPCRRGHHGHRYASNRACVVCVDDAQIARRSKAGADDSFDSLLN